MRPGSEYERAQNWRKVRGNCFNSAYQNKLSIHFVQSYGGVQLFYNVYILLSKENQALLLDLKYHDMKAILLYAIGHRN